MQKNEVELKIRTFLIEEVMKEEASVATASEQIEFDSLEQVEITMFIEEEFDTSLSNLTDKFITIDQIVDYVLLNSN